MGQTGPVQLVAAFGAETYSRYVDPIPIRAGQVGIQVYTLRRRRFRLLRRSSAASQYTERSVHHLLLESAVRLLRQRDGTARSVELCAKHALHNDTAQSVR